MSISFLRVLRVFTALGVVMAGIGVLPSGARAAGPDVYRESGKVVHVADGDTFDIKLAGSGAKQRVRIIGIQAPEIKWCGGNTATAALKKLLPIGTKVRLSSIKAESGNSPQGIWRIKRSVYKKVNGQWVDIAPQLLTSGLVFPFPFIGETTHNEQYTQLAFTAARARIGLYEPNRCGAAKTARERIKLEVVTGAPGADPSANAEFVMLFNGSDHDVNLSGWMVQDTSPLNSYFFPKGTTLRSNDYVVVFSGKGDNGVAPNGARDDRYFHSGLGSIWNDNTEDIAYLFDNEGRSETGNLRDWLILNG
ncbi:MAG: lamin tail domain-containing protein [Candidatus Nanopelagicales bacterium]